jgi:hypothetical protein
MISGRSESLCVEIFSVEDLEILITVRESFDNITAPIPQ